MYIKNAIMLNLLNTFSTKGWFGYSTSHITQYIHRVPLIALQLLVWQTIQIFIIVSFVVIKFILIFLKTID